MKKKKRFIILTVLLLVIFTSSVQAASRTTSSRSIKLNRTKISMYVTESTTIKVTDARGKSRKATWKSSNTKIATVKNGVITAKKAGTVTITARSNGKKKSCKVTVRGDWYQKVVRSQNATYKVKRLMDGKMYTVYRKNFDKYRLLDINKDGVKELMLYNNAEIVLFTYNKGKVKPLIWSYIRGVFSKGKYFIIQRGTSSENTCYLYTLKNGKLKQEGTYFHTTSSAYRIPIYEINGKKCSRSVFFKNYNKYMDGAKSLR